MSAERPLSAVAVRALCQDDLDEVVRIDALHTGHAEPEIWQRIFAEFLGAQGRDRTFGFGVQGDQGLAGFLFGEIRAVEFGFGPCGWVFALGIEEGFRRRGIATALLEAARKRFQDTGVDKIRTMVRRNDVPVLSFFRQNGFVGGPYVQLELEVEANQP